LAKISIEKRPCRREGCGFTQDSKTVLRERADVETRFGLLASVESAAPTTFLNTGRLERSRCGGGRIRVQLTGF
jgi:hypothetical protein